MYEGAISSVISGWTLVSLSGYDIYLYCGLLPSLAIFSATYFYYLRAVYACMLLVALFHVIRCSCTLSLQYISSVVR